MMTTPRLQDALAVLCATYLCLLQTNLALALRSFVFGAIGVVAIVLVLRRDARAQAALSPPARACSRPRSSRGPCGRPRRSRGRARPRTRSASSRPTWSGSTVATAALLLSLRDTVVFRRYVATILAAFAVLALASLGLAAAATPWNDKLMHHGVGTWSTHLVLVAPLILLAARALRPPASARAARPRAAAVALLALTLASAYATENRMVWPALLASLAVVGAGERAALAGAVARAGPRPRDRVRRAGARDRRGVPRRRAAQGRVVAAAARVDRALGRRAIRGSRSGRWCATASPSGR